MENFRALAVKLASSDRDRPLTESRKALIKKRLRDFFPDFHTPNHPTYASEEYNMHLWKVPKEQHTIEYCDGIYHKIIGKDGHGYCKTYGRGMPLSAVYVRGSGPSQSTAPSFMDEITRRVTQDVRV